MTSRPDGKQIAVRLNESMISRLDHLAKLGSTNRHHLMLSLVSFWLNVLDETKLARVFYIANLHRVREEQRNGNFAYEHEFQAERIPEKPLPIKLTDGDNWNVGCFANHSHLSKHQLMKTMIIVGIEELEKIIDVNGFDIASVEPKLLKGFKRILQKGDKAHKAYLKG